MNLMVMNVDVLKFVQENIFLVGIAVASGGMLVWPMFSRGTGGPSVGTVEAVHLMNREDAIVIDVRDAAEYASGHILNARNLPAAELEARAGELEKFKERPVIVTCESGSRSGPAAASLRKKGFTRVVSLSGGIADWKAASLPTEKA